MTWDQLKTKIESLSPEQRQTEEVSLEENVSINDDNDPLGGVLDDGHSFLVTVKDRQIEI